MMLHEFMDLHLIARIQVLMLPVMLCASMLSLVIFQLTSSHVAHDGMHTCIALTTGFQASSDAGSWRVLSIGKDDTLTIWDATQDLNKMILMGLTWLRVRPARQVSAHAGHQL